MLQTSTTKSAAPHVITVEPGNAQRAYAVLTLAFAADPPSRWLYPEPEAYVRYFPAFARALGGAAFGRQTAVASPDHAAVALWLDPDAAPDEHAMERLIEESVAPRNRATVAAVVEEMVRHHPDEPHWYLPFIGVEPPRQGRGLGAALLQAAVARCDAEGLPAYLESTNPRNRPLYERHGFEAVGEIRVGDCPPIVPMLRRAKA
jgi:GNAT superfamily N-acetyltransferase